ncbi:M1 family metallopeptidase [Flavihumibacter profundi]|uniref:M1 family metallopeptidase n=1 Tax=Flavihumibacter profundi TaxID=2716883 RepID=UPI001CC4435A|nr:M1 family metallopeptidase [Flavihumibacter profundi]MBZ5855548.1 M1 family metallopeptidase [Flavihumibacter profundi]
MSILGKLPARMKYSLFLLLGLSIATTVISQQHKPTIYDPRDLFPANPIIPPGNAYRSATGEPGESYWQNRASYTINASLDDKQNTITGSETITFTNNSPHALPYLWLQLDQNAFRPHSRGLDAKLFLDSNDIKRSNIPAYGYIINGVEIINSATNPSKKTLATYKVEDTRMQVFLPQPLAKGKSVSFQVKYNYRIPENFYNADFNVNRTDILPTKDGPIYSIAQWYPRMCVLDDVEGWNTLPYLGNGEFYLEYGDFNVNLTLPSAYIVVASGELLNPQEVMTPLQLKRWNQAKHSEQKVFIRTPDEVTNNSSRPQKSTCTWKFSLRNARDFAWGASKSFVMEGININLPAGKKAMGISVYPVASKQPQSWDRSSEYIKFSIEYFSDKWYPYPYPCAVNVASNLDGMEYPGIVFCSAKDTGNNYFKVVKHELGHTWFPMIVGSNERKYAWMDEGFNVFIDYIADGQFNKGEFKGYTADELPYDQYFTDSLTPIITRPDALKGSFMVFTTQYLKTAYVLRLLREQVVGEERFDYALKKYIRDWAYKHPTPWDFFRSINNTTGEDLTWFWKAMFIENYKLDQAVTRLSYIDNTPSKGANIYLANLEKAAMPMTVEVTTTSGIKQVYKLPVEIWENDHEYILKTNTTESIQSIIIDPNKVFPDVNRDNNNFSYKSLK